MPTVKYSISDYIADGTTTDYLITWDYLDDDHITVEIDGVTNSDPSANHTFIKLNNTTVRVTDTIGSAIVSGKEIQIKRATPITTRPISFSDGSALLAADLNKNSDYLLFSMQEALDQVDFSVQYQEEAEGFKDATEVLRDETQALRNLSEADEQTATQQATISTTKAGEAAGSAAAALVSENAASGSAGEALASKNEATTQAGLATTNGAAQVSLAAGQVALATTQAGLATTNGATQVSLAAGQVALATTQVGLATTKASDASGSASTASGHANTATTQAGIATTKAGEASTSATTATTKAGEASTSASAAAGSATAASDSAAAAAAAFDSFDDKYLGSKTGYSGSGTGPALDNDGNALVEGALFFSSDANEMRVYDGANWIAASSAGTASLILYEFTATNAQTTFSGADDNSATLGYTAGNLQVVMNGVILDPSDFTASNGTSVVLGSGAATGDLLNVYAFKSFTVADTVSASAGGTFQGNVTVAGAFTSQGIDDNATSTAMTLDGSGNVGIGTSSPTVLLDLESASPIIRLTDSDASGTPECQISGAGGDLIFDADRDNEKASSLMLFKVDGSERMRLDAQGHAIIPAGVTLGTAAGVYSAANTLDDYEVGSFVPFLDNATGGDTATYNTRQGHYVKVGDLIYCQFRIALVAKGGGSGNIRIGGLPFSTSAGHDFAGANCDVFYNNAATSWVSLKVGARASNNSLYVYGQTAAARNTIREGNFTSSDINNNFEMRGSITYRGS